MSSLHSRITNKRGFYEAGKKTKANQDFWNANQDFEQTAYPDRDVMRARARWLSANNAIMDNIDNAIINNVVGKGVELQMGTSRKNFNRMVERRFKVWMKAKNCDLTKRHNFKTMQRLLIKSRMVDGEVFIYMAIVDRKLKLQLLEPDILDTARPDGGIELNSNNEIVFYHFYDASGKRFKKPASDIINFYIPERPTQYRGVTEYKSAVIDIKNFSAFQSATIQAMRARANIAYVVKQDGKPNHLGADISKQTQTVNGITVQYLKRGESIEKLDPDSAPTDYTQFSESTIRLIATARKISYELAFRDYSKVNFASSRASLLQDHKRFDAEQDHLTDYFLDIIFERWFDIEVMSGRIKAPKYEDDPEQYLEHRWVMPKRDLVDPLKEITAIEKAIDLNLTTETDEALARGYRYEDILLKKQAEMEMRKKYGIPERVVDPNAVSDGNGDGEVDFDDNITGAESSNNKK
jgi:lambda family phage portal protein